jgi:hypothetical protein
MWVRVPLPAPITIRQMKVNGNSKTIRPESWVEVLNVWAAPSYYDRDSNASNCAFDAAITYAGVDDDEARGWSLDFANTGYDKMFYGLNRAFNKSLRYFDVDAGAERDPHDTNKPRKEDDPILRVAKAYSKDPDAFDLEVYESESGMPFVKFERNGKVFEFCIVEDYTMFISFNDWLKKQNAILAAEAKRKSAEEFLAELED